MIQKITAEEFQAFIEKDPNWAAHLTHEVEVTTPCVMPHSDITCLSPLISFTGRNKNGVCADFTHCEKLKDAAATFHGKVILSRSGILTTQGIRILKPNDSGEALSCIQCGDLEEITGEFPGSVSALHCPNLKRIRDLKITKSDGSGNAGFFESCPQLEVATGHYAGFVSFCNCSGLVKIENLTITRPNHLGNAVSFLRCDSLEEATGNYPGFAEFKESGIKQIRKISVTHQDSFSKKSASFNDCMNLKTAEGVFEGEITFNNSSIQEIFYIQCTGLDLKGCNKLMRCPDHLLNIARIEIEVRKQVQNAEKARRALKQPNLLF